MFEVIGIAILLAGLYFYCNTPKDKRIDADERCRVRGQDARDLRRAVGTANKAGRMASKALNPPKLRSPRIPPLSSRRR